METCEIKPVISMIDYVKKIPLFQIVVIVLLLLILARVNEAVELADEASALSANAEGRLVDVEGKIDNINNLIQLLH